MAADNLSKLLDSLAEMSIYVIEEDTHRLLYFNQRCRDMSRGRAEIGVKCHEVWPEVCSSCPLNGLEGKKSYHIVCYDPLFRNMVDVSANRIMWDGHIPAVVVTASPHRLNFEEEQGFEKIQKMYAQSLVTVFDECIIANLTADYYMNCQKDAMWTDIPEQGNFGSENQNYSKKVLHPDDLETFQANFSRDAMLKLFGQGRKHITKRLRRMGDDGSYHMVEFSASRVGQDGDEDVWCVLVFRDIQEEYLLEQQRNMELIQLATAAKGAYQMLIAVNLTKNTYHMLEYERYPVKKPGDQGIFQDLIEHEVSTVRPDYQEEFIKKFSRESLIKAFSGGEQIVTMEVPHFGEDGVYHWNFTQVVPVKSPYNDDLIEITLSRNIDGERRMQEERLEKERRAKELLEDALRKAEKASQAKSDFLSKMSHDIRTPMNAVIGMTELARIHIKDESRMEDYLKKIADSGAHLLSLINEVLDVSKIESGTDVVEEGEFNLRDLVGETVEMVRLSIEHKKQKLSIEIDGDLHSEVIGDARRLKQVLVNILENASKYTREGGNLFFTVEEIKMQEQQTGTYRFVIEDNGIGMTPEYLEHIFDPFSRADDSRTSKIPGTGLGMTIVKNLVSMMGGEIQVESRYKKGSKFTVTLCLAKCEEPADTVREEEIWTEESFSGLRVLLAEDNELNRQIAEEMLELFGVETDSVKNGQEAADAVRHHPAFYYDLVLMDVQMPVLNGYEATKKIRELKMEGIRELPIIAMTADAFAEDVRQARLAGMSGHLPKPVSVEQLRKCLSECLSWKKKNR